MLKFASSLRSRLILLILMAVVPAFGLLYYSAAEHQQLMAEQVKQNSLAAVRLIAAEHDRVLDNAHEFLVTLSRVPQIRSSDKAECRKILSGLLEPRYADLMVADRAGNPLCVALPPGRGLAMAAGIHHSRSIQTYDFSVGTVRVDQNGAKMLLDVAYPVMDQPGVVRAVVSAALDLSWISHIAIDDYLSTGSTFTLMDTTGVVLLRYPGGSDWIGKPLITDGAEQGAVSKQTVEATGADGVRRLFAFSRLKNPIGGKVVYAAVDLPASQAFAENHRLLIQNTLALGVASALVLAFAWFGSDVFVLRRLWDIIATTKKVAAGNLDARTILRYDTTELGQVARAFDQLADRLERRQAEAQQQRRRQDALYDLNRAITSTLDVSSVLETLLDHITALFPPYSVSVSWIDAQSKTLKPIAHRTPADRPWSDAERLAAESLSVEVLRQNSAIAIPEMRADVPAVGEICDSAGWASYFGLPLMVENETVGVLSFYGSATADLSADETQFLTALVNEAATAIHNSQLFEQTRRQARELEKSNKIKDEFLGVMSHELRTPLNVIMNYSEAAMMGAFGEISAEQRRVAAKIRAQADQLLTLINGILEITKIESGTVLVEKNLIDLNDFMAELRSDYVRPPEKDVKLLWGETDDLPVIVSDRMKLKQIATNLINNAIKFTDHGSVTVSGAVSACGRSVEFHVADTGAGIPNDLLPSIFDKFRQIDSGINRNHSGAGLGLYIVKNFVTLLGGAIDVESKLGEGTHFTVSLPIQSEMQPNEARRQVALQPTEL